MSLTTIDWFTKKITLYIPFVILILGNFGCLLNLITFTNKKLRRNSCGWYFLMSTIFDFAYLNFGLISKLASDHYGSMLENKSSAYCKIRVFLTWTLPCISTSYLILATLDRCLATSKRPRLRLFSQVKMAYRITGVPILLYSLTGAHQLYYFDLRPNCSAKLGSYSQFLSLYSILWTNLIPQSIMLVSAFVIQYHVRASRRRIASQSEHQLQQSHNRTDSQMITIVLVQVFISLALLSMRTVYYSYIVLSKNLFKSPERIALETLFWQISSFLMYINHSKSFFVNTLTSTLFRKLLIQRLLLGFRRVSSWKKHIQPSIITNFNPNMLHKAAR